MMDLAGFSTPPEDRYFEHYLPGAVHEFGLIKVQNLPSMVGSSLRGGTLRVS